MQPCIKAILLQYTLADESLAVRKVKLNEGISFNQAQPVMGFIGAGNYASRILIPAFKEAGAQFHTLATAGGINSIVHGEKAGFAEASTDTAEMLTNPEINTVAIVTRHDSHARFVAQALEAGKHVFVEKQLAIDFGGLEQVEIAYKAAHHVGNGPQLMVGFNRRFSPQVQKMKALLEPVKEPKSFFMTMNAGATPADHWRGLSLHRPDALPGR